MYDGFALASAANVTAVQWQGTYINHNNLASNPAAPNVTSFVVSFYADDNGQPGAQLSTATLPVSACAETSLGTVGFNAFNDSTTYQIAYYSYRAALPAPFTAAAGQTYWLSVVGNDGSATPVWSWYASTADGSTVCFQDYAGSAFHTFSNPVNGNKESSTKSGVAVRSGDDPANSFQATGSARRVPDGHSAGGGAGLPAPHRLR